MKPEIFETLTRDFELHGRKYSAEIEISCTSDEYVSFDDLVDSKADPKGAEKLAHDLDSANASVLVILVEATCGDLPDLLGSDSLGCCIVYNRQDVTDIVTTHDMVENALSDLVSSYERELESAKRKVERLEQIKNK
jgi:hypothetical protein